MKWLRLFFKPPFKDIIEQTKDYIRMKHEINNLFYHIYKASKNEEYEYILDESSMWSSISYIQEEFDRISKENKELKESLNAIKNA